MEREKLRRAVKSYAGKKETFHFKLPEELKSSQIENAIRKYAKNIRKEDVVALMDTTLFGSGKSGYLLTEHKIYQSFLKKNCDLDGIVSYSKSEGGTTLMLRYSTGGEQEFYMSAFPELEDLLQRIVYGTEANEEEQTEEEQTEEEQTEEEQAAAESFEGELDKKQTEEEQLIDNLTREDWLMDDLTTEEMSEETEDSPVDVESAEEAARQAEEEAQEAEEQWKAAAAEAEAARREVERTKRRVEEAARALEEAIRAAEEKCRAKEAAREAEEKRRAKEAAREAEEKRRAEETAAREAEEKRRAEEAAAREAEQRKTIRERLHREKKLGRLSELYLKPGMVIRHEEKKYLVVEISSVARAKRLPCDIVTVRDIEYRGKFIDGGHAVLSLERSEYVEVLNYTKFELGPRENRIMNNATQFNRKTLAYLYWEDGEFYLMDMDTYDQIVLQEETVAGSLLGAKENEEVIVTFYGKVPFWVERVS